MLRKSVIEAIVSVQWVTKPSYIVPLSMRKTLVIVLNLCLALQVFSQDEKFPQTLTAGAEFRPIFPAAFLNTGSQSVSNDSYSIQVDPKFGFSAGMVIRYGFHKRFALETGLSFVQRNYNLGIQRDSVAPVAITPGSPPYNSQTDFTIVGYEHPIKLLVFVRLSEQIYMNAAAGFQFTFYPSDIFSSDEEGNPTDRYFKHSSLRLGFDGKPGSDGFIHGGGIVNLGFEYRTKKIGNFYLGGTYQIPFADIYRSKFEYTDETNPVPVGDGVQAIYLNGSYLTFDIRYFFHSKPIAKREKKSKKKSEK